MRGLENLPTMSPWSLPCPKSVVMQVTFLLLFFLYRILYYPAARASTFYRGQSPSLRSGFDNGTVRIGLLCGVWLRTVVCSVESYTVRNSLHLGFWLNAVVYSAESDSTQWFAVQSPNSTQWFAVWSPTVRNSLHFAVRSPNLRSGLQCRVRLYTVVCSV